MKKIFVFLCLFLSVSIFGSSFCVSAEDGVGSYAKVVSLSALFDRYTEEVEFAADFRGAVSEDRCFKALLSCSRLSGGKWLTGQTVSEQSFKYGDCLVSPTRLEGRIALDSAVFSDKSRKDFVLRIEGEKAESVGGVVYSTMEGAECAVKPKPEPEGAFFALGSECVPSVSAKGGIILLSIFPTDINSLLSGGLRELSFTLIYDKALLSFRNADISGARLTEASQTESGVLIRISSDTGLKRGDKAVLELYFRAENAGEAHFSVCGVTGSDAAARVYSDGKSNALSAGCLIRGKPFPLGDVNFDGLVDNMDAAAILRCDAGLSGPAENGDVNRDGLIDNMDAAAILLYDAGMISGFDA